MKARGEDGHKPAPTARVGVVGPGTRRQNWGARSVTSPHRRHPPRVGVVSPTIGGKLGYGAFCAAHGGSLPAHGCHRRRGVCCEGAHAVTQSVRGFGDRTLGSAVCLVRNHGDNSAWPTGGKKGGPLRHPERPSEKPSRRGRPGMSKRQTGRGIGRNGDAFLNAERVPGVATSRKRGTADASQPETPHHYRASEFR